MTYRTYITTGRCRTRTNSKCIYWGGGNSRPFVYKREEKMEVLEIKRVKYLPELREVAELASEIWHECFEGIISRGQIDYMVEKYQSLQAMCDQIDKCGYSYYAVKESGELCGYIGIKPEADDRLFLSKLYLRSDKRGRGIGSRMLDRVKEEAKAAGKSRIYLTVNKHNDRAIGAYERYGYKRTDSTVTDIGSGYVMDDYIYEYSINS